ncbi:MAG: hypothetical protein ACI9R3_005633 [Verrucomicrobiales bacterium]|jgi:hypothetical protein
MPTLNVPAMSDGIPISSRWIGIVTLVLSLLLVSGCGERQSGDEADAHATEGGTGSNPSMNSGKIKFKQPGGGTAFSIKLKDDGLKLVNDREEELVRVTRDESGKHKFKDPTDKVLGYVTGGVPKYRIKDATQEQVLFEFRRQDGGDWKLEDGAEALLCKVLKRDYGWKIEDASENELAKVKTDGGRLSIRDAKGEVRLYTDDAMPSAAAVPFALPQLDQGQAAALMAALLKTK